MSPRLVSCGWVSKERKRREKRSARSMLCQSNQVPPHPHCSFLSPPLPLLPHRVCCPILICPEGPLSSDPLVSPFVHLSMH